MIQIKNSINHICIMNKDKVLSASIDSESNKKINQIIKIIRKVCNRHELNLHEPFFLL